VQTLIWTGEDEPRMEIARVEVDGADVRAEGTQIGIAYELRYRLAPGRLELGVVGGASASLGLDGADFFDLAFSPLLNTLPVLHDALHHGGLPRDYVMAFVDVPSLEVSRQDQRYEPFSEGLVRFRTGDFTAMLELDDDGFVVRYPGLAVRKYPPPP
jgi:uncharacterized protein